MARKLLLQLLLLALPFVTYFIYVWLARREDPRNWRRAPWFWLFASGLALSIAGVVAVALWGGGAPGENYVPPTLKDGAVVPGHFE